MEFHMGKENENKDSPVQPYNPTDHEDSELMNTLNADSKTPNPLASKALLIDTNVNPLQHRKIQTSPVYGQKVSATSLATPKSSTSPTKKDRIEKNTPSSCTIGMIGDIILRKRNSISFFVDLISPINSNPLKTITEETDIEEDNIKSPRSVWAMKSPTSLPATPARKNIEKYSFPVIKGHLNRPTAKEQLKRLNSRLDAAARARHELLEKRRCALIEQSEAIKMRLLIHDSKQTIERLKLEAKQEYLSSNAQLNRHLFLRQRREYFARKVEHAKRVMILQKMKNLLTLRRALSENFADLIMQDDADNYLTDSESRNRNVLGLSVHVEDPQEEYENTAGDSPETLAKPESSNDDQEYYPSEEARRFHAEYTSNYLFSTSPKSRAETLSSRIRRTKSLPDIVLQDTNDTTFLELLNLLPPITRFTLRELDMDEILGNAQLRHDIVFDPDLQFKSSNEDDEQEILKSKAYWEELKREVSLEHLYRIPLLIAEIRAILIEMLPNGLEIQDEINTNIDVNLINQQLEHGIMNPSSLIIYISDLMKTNCAPIRDPLVDKMVDHLKQGDIVETLKECFNILELMKLDYANHQLNRLRPYIIENAVSFEFKYFKMQLNAGQIELTNTVDWINSSWEKYLQNVDKPNPVHDLYPQAVVDITAKASRFADEDIFPETLKMDQNRVVTFFNSWQDVTILATIMIVFKQSAGPKCSIAELEQAKKDIWILLNDSESTMEHVTIQMAHSAGKIRGKLLTANEITGIDTVTNNALAPGSKIYDLVQKRIGLHLENALSKQPINKTELEKHGLTILQEEIENMVKKFVPVSDLNRAVYSSIYATIIEHIRKGTPIKEISDQIIESLE